MAAETHSPNYDETQARFNNFVDTHPNRPGRHRSGRHRKGYVEGGKPQDSKEHRGFRERASALRKLGSKALNAGLNVYARAYSKGATEQAGVIYADHERAAQAEHARRQAVETHPTTEQPATGPDQSHAPLFDQDFQENSSRLRIPAYVGRLHQEPGDAGFNGVVDHAEELATRGDVLVAPDAEAADIELPAVRSGWGDYDMPVAGRQPEPVHSYGNEQGSVVEEPEAHSRTQAAGMDASAPVDRPARHGETYAQRLARRRAYVGHHRDQLVGRARHAAR
ncbi:MAG TPA: hypothetical protein VLA88_01850 [Candidatus Saccharimonadales bacterium]|nr:hypothetical protein [Candidatus Saccharimonadales bacterium]